MLENSIWGLVPILGALLAYLSLRWFRNVIAFRHGLIASVAIGALGLAFGPRCMCSDILDLLVGSIFTSVIAGFVAFAFGACIYLLLRKVLR